MMTKWTLEIHADLLGRLKGLCGDDPIVGEVADELDRLYGRIKQLQAPMRARWKITCPVKDA